MRVNKIGNENWKVETSKLIYIKGQIWELAKLGIVRNIERTENSKICQFLELNFDFPNWKNSRLIFPIVKFQKFSIWKITKISQTFIIDKFIKWANFRNCSILKITKFSKYDDLENYQNSKNFQFGNLSYILSVGIIWTNKKNWINHLSLL